MGCAVPKARATFLTKTTSHINILKISSTTPIQIKIPDNPRDPPRNILSRNGVMVSLNRSRPFQSIRSGSYNENPSIMANSTTSSFSNIKRSCVINNSIDMIKTCLVSLFLRSKPTVTALTGAQRVILSILRKIPEQASASTLKYYRLGVLGFCTNLYLTENFIQLDELSGVLESSSNPCQSTSSDL